jgi:hypothetical protein
LTFSSFPPATLFLAIIYPSVMTCGELCEFGEKAKKYDDADHRTARLATRGVADIRHIHVFAGGLPLLHVPLGES